LCRSFKKKSKSKDVIIIFLDSLEGLLSSEEQPLAFQRKHQARQIRNVFFFPLFLGSFAVFMDPEADPWIPLNSNPIRIWIRNTGFLKTVHM
jgi:hypothetical protein